ncbi:HxsD-like protein [Lacrimispora sp. 210928-DFI.3.58]|uniref:HxsD-like protein n=1 Tax=Lacrimispora sp. 210928-DFI.3.58 TaxID=2883214 RepID=UPI001D074D39|nr:HxsD-like protein [Lacrimispora sp. 210928-DFI.3.58]MCB7320469.1 HxsD-like protein [Lacrimispora sp. 210928-DFI.3.58]
MITKITEIYDKEIYSKKVVRAAIKMYTGICKIDFEEKDRVIVCTFYGEMLDIELIKNEFGNFLIEMMQQRAAL